VVPGKYFVVLERVVREHYQTLVVDAPSEDAAEALALQKFQAGAAAYMSCTPIEAPVARARPLREKHLRRSVADAATAEDDSGLHTAESFLGDADTLVAPTGQFPGARSEAVTCAQARRICRNFDASGHSNHSGQGATLWVVLEHCAVRGIAYNLHVLPGVGFYIERAKAVEDGLALSMPVESTYAGLPEAMAPR
jgi:hypothetical protein